MKLRILGTGSASPTEKAFQSAQVLELTGKKFLIDCGEGTQMRCMQYGIELAQIDAIFISHAHLDHYIGLPGLLKRSWRQRRTQPLPVYAPEEVFENLERIFDSFYPGFTIDFRVTEPDRQYEVVRTSRVVVSSIPLEHDAPASGFLFEEITAQSIVKRFAYCSDTAYDNGIIPQIAGVELLYHEATYSEENGRNGGVLCVHSTTKHAATVARKANAGHLIIGHYSIKNQDYKSLEREAREIFPNTTAAYDGFVWEKV
ncbi:MAG: ribonuclease Z [Prevotellaceae bacterium]|jgi:ribonuclease Z|nr:ribonuclease Z [Prevotellaceae bacterium]